MQYSCKTPVFLGCVWLGTILLTSPSVWAEQGLIDLPELEVYEVPRGVTAPPVLLAAARTLREHGLALPEALLREAVESALRQEAPWAYAEAAIRAFDLYQERAWAAPLMAPFVARHATTILLNAPYFAALHRAWTQQSIAQIAPLAPALVLKELQTLASLDTVWAKKLADAAAEAVPALVFAEAKTLLAVDKVWARQGLEKALPLVPRQAIRAVSAYRQEPWGEALFVTAVLHDPQWLVHIMAFPSHDMQAVLEAAEGSTSPYIQMLRHIAHTAYPEEIRSKMAVFVQDIVSDQRSVEEAARLSMDDRQYLRTLVTMKLAAPERMAVDLALKDQVLLVIDPINSQFEQPDAIRFRAVETYTARELYILLTYSADEIFTSSFRGIFERLLARMQQEGLRGELLLSHVQYLHFHTFMKSLASFNRLEAFLGTLPSAVARMALLARCLQELGAAAPDAMARILTAAEIVESGLDIQSLRLIRDMILNEYTAAEHERNRRTMAIYGLLAAWLERRRETALHTPELLTIAAKYRAYLPSFKALPMTSLFPQGHNLQRHFFYNDDDGKQSFQSFMAQYRSAKAWHIEDRGTYVHIQAQKQGIGIDVYANKPEHDLSSGDVLAPVFQESQQSPSVVVHRGHSPYVTDTIAAIPPNAAIVFLGNCGSYTRLEATLEQAPQAHIITTKGIGSVTINDPMLKSLNEAMLRGQDLLWGDFWKQLETTLGHNPRFLDYVPPDKNTSVIFLRAYRTLLASQNGMAQQ